MPELGTVDLTVDELAARTGLSVRTVRYYATRGLLPPPKLRGRLGLYGADHVARLELVRELQEAGFTLTAVEGFLQKLPRDAAPEDLALLRTLLTPWMPERAEEISRAEFDRRAGRQVDDAVLDRLALLGVIERRDRDAVAVRSGLLTLGLQALDANVPIETLLAAKETVERHAGAVAEDLTRLFRDAVVQPFLDSDGTPEARAQMINALDALKPVAVQSLVIAFQQAVNRAIRESAADF